MDLGLHTMPRFGLNKEHHLSRHIASSATNEPWLMPEAPGGKAETEPFNVALSLGDCQLPLGASKLSAH